MANKTEKLDLKVIKPGATNKFDPVFEVETCEARAKVDGDYIVAVLKPHSGGAQNVGAITMRMPAILAPGMPLGTFAVLVGQDPTKGFDVGKAATRLIRVSFAPVEPTKEA